MTTDTLTTRQLNRATLARQMLLEREQISAVAAVERLAGMQAQEAKPPFIGLWTRVAGFRREELHAALHDYSVVRGILMRSTVHLVSAADYARFWPALQPMLRAAIRTHLNRATGLQPEQVLPVARALLNEEPRSFTELATALHAVFPDVEPRTLAHVARAELPLLIVPASQRWAFPTASQFTLAEEWLAEPLSTDQAPHALVLRYLAAFGPASVADVQTWSRLTRLAPVLNELRPQLRVFRDEQGRELFDLPDAPRPDDDVPAPPRFLPNFDNLVLSHADRTRVLADRHRPFMASKNGLVPATFLVDGFVRGAWKIERKRDTATLRITTFEPLLTDAVDALIEEGEALLRFVEEDAASFDVRVVD
jgi:hypothetical protein